MFNPFPPLAFVGNSRIPIGMSLPVEHLSPRDSLIARLDPRWRLAAIVVAIACIAIMRWTPTLAIALGVALIFACIARVPRRWFVRRMSVLLLALTPFLIVLPLTVDRGGPSAEVFGLRLSVDGLDAAIALNCKPLAILALVLALLASAPIHVTLRAAQRMGTPRLLVQLTLLGYRYVFLLLDEFYRLRIAVRVRGFRNRTNRHSLRTVGQVTGTLLVRGTERAERVAQAMRCRGFDGAFRTLDEFHTSKRDVVWFLIIVGLFGVLLIVDIV